MARTRESGDPQLVTNGVTRSTWRRLVRASNWHRYYQAALVGADLLAVLLATVVTVHLTPSPSAGFDTNNQQHFFYLTVWLLLPLAWLLSLWGTGSYDRRYFGMGNEEFKRVIRAAMFMLALVSFAALTFKADVSRVAVAVILLAAAVLVTMFRYGARYGLHRMRATGRGVQRVLLIGSYPEALEVYRTVRRASAAGLVPVGIYVTEGASSVRNLDTPVPVFAGTDVVTCAEQLEADTLAVCGSASADASDLRRLAWQLEGTGRDLVVAPQLTDIAGPRVHIRPVEGLPLLHVEEPKISGIGWLIKNVLDISSSVLGLMLLSPLFLGVAIAVKMDSPGPVFFRQNRVGRDGETFSCWKFRTMYIDAEERQAALMMHNETDGLLFKMKDDPRITNVGKWLRRTSIDEFPQLINVVRGEMSLVRPGITGLWQVSGRSDLSWDDAVRLDLYYVDNWSLTTDLQILFRTVAVVLRRKGAY